MRKSKKIVSIFLLAFMFLSFFNTMTVFATDDVSDSGDANKYYKQYGLKLKEGGVQLFNGSKNADGSYNPINLKTTKVNVVCSEKMTKVAGCSKPGKIVSVTLEKFIKWNYKSDLGNYDKLGMAAFRVLCQTSDPQCKKPILYTSDKKSYTKAQFKCTNTSNPACKEWNAKYLDKAWDLESKKKSMNKLLNIGIGTKDMDPDPKCKPKAPSSPGAKDFKCCEPPNDKDNPPKCHKEPPCTVPTKENNCCGKGCEPEDHDKIRCDGIEYDRYVHKRTESAGRGFVSGVSHVRATLDPVRVPDLNSLPRNQVSYWYDTHVSQSTPPQLTPYGEYLQENKALLAVLVEMGKSGGIGEDSNYRQAWETFQAGAEAAIAAGVPPVSIDFNRQNRIGYARGGAWTFTEWRKTTSVRANHKQDKYDEQDCRDTFRWKKEWDGWRGEYYWYKEWYQEVYIKNYDVEIDGNYTEENIEPIESGGFSPEKSYQIINVRCNEQEFDRLMSRTGSTVKSRSPASSSGVSPIVNHRIARFYNGLGVDFYYSSKGCENEYRCTSKPANSQFSDRKNNIQDTGEQVNGLYGAQSDGKSSSRFSFFRDNIPQTIRNDIWWLNPLNANPNDWDFNSADSASATFVTMDTTATPLADLFNLEDSSHNVVLTGNDIQNRNNALLYYNEVNIFNWRASWASERAHPHKMNIRYGYRPETIAEFTPDTLDSDQNIETSAEQETMDMYCDVKYNTKQEDIPIISNKPKEDEYKPIKEFVEDSFRNLIVQFVKSSAE